MVERADAATKLHRVLRRLQDRIDGSAIDAFTGKGAVQVDDMQPFEALVFEGAGLCGRIRIIDGRLVHIAQLEANALAVLEVDGGKKDHECIRALQGVQVRKLAMSFRPRAWLFSG